MKTKAFLQRTLFLALMATLMGACTKTAFDEVERNRGNADFSNYVAVGNSLTQGYQDNGLYEEGQRNSYPALLAEQMKKVQQGMTDFDQPLVDENGSGYLHLEYLNSELEVIKPSNPDHGAGYQESSSWSTWGDNMTDLRFNNLGVSGIRLNQCVSTQPGEAQLNYGILSNNPYARFLDWGDFLNPTDYVVHVDSSDPTFFTNWLGNNDVLGYANAGGETSIANPLDDLTDPSEFESDYDSIMTVLTQNGAKGICVTIPDVTTIPMFNTVKPDMFDRTIWIELNNGSDTIKVRPSDNILLTALDSIEEKGKGTRDEPLESESVLDSTETATAREHTDILNSKIRTVAQDHGIPVLDMHEFLGTLKSGIVVDGIDLNTKFIEGGTFSLDGVHPNQRGYALIANQFIEKINSEYGADLPPVEVGNYPGVTFP